MIPYLARHALASTLAQSLIRAVYPFDAKRQIQRGPLRGQSITIAPSMGMTYIWDLDHSAWEWVYHYVNAGDVVYDVGANAGQSTRHLAQAVGPTGKVIAFEPAPSVFRYLTANVMGVPQVTAVEGAASDRDGTGEFMFDPSHPTTGRLGEAKTMDLPPSPERTEVRFMRLDSYRDHGWPAPTFLKIDVEGAAGSVFAGAHDVLATYRPRMYIELHDIPEQAAVREALLQYDYRAIWIGPGTIEDLKSRWTSPLYCEPVETRPFL